MKFFLAEFYTVMDTVMLGPAGSISFGCQSPPRIGQAKEFMPTSDADEGTQKPSSPTPP